MQTALQVGKSIFKVKRELMIDRTKAVLWSGAWDTANGQALVTARVFERQINLDWWLAVYPVGAQGIIGVIGAVLQLTKGIMIGKCRIVYLVCSRSLIGFFRDMPALMAAVVGVRVIVHVHGSDFSGLLSRRGPVGWLARKLYQNCEIIIPSAHLIKEISKFSFQRVHVVENFATNSNANPTPPMKKFRILWNSNVLSSKGIRELYYGIKQARAEGLDANLVILGKPLADSEASALEMEAFLNKIKVEEWVDVRGPVSAAEAALAVDNSDLVALPSRYSSECQPLALIQAMCAGRKILATNTEALKATLDGYPAIFANCESSSIAKILPVAHALPEISMNARLQAQQRFSCKRFDLQISKILN